MAHREHHAVTRRARGRLLLRAMGAPPHTHRLGVGGGLGCAAAHTLHTSHLPRRTSCTLHHKPHTSHITHHTAPHTAHHTSLKVVTQSRKAGTQSQTHGHAHGHVHVHVHVHVHGQVHVHVQVHTTTHAHMHMHARAYMYIHATCMHMHTCTGAPTLLRAPRGAAGGKREAGE